MLTSPKLKPVPWTRCGMSKPHVDQSINCGSVLLSDVKKLEASLFSLADGYDRGSNTARMISSPRLTSLMQRVSQPIILYRDEG
jgi:hypothetical protein